MDAFSSFEVAYSAFLFRAVQMIKSGTDRTHCETCRFCDAKCRSVVRIHDIIPIYSHSILLFMHMWFCPLGKRTCAKGTLSASHLQHN
jgi:hypothetical protein